MGSLGWAVLGVIARALHAGHEPSGVPGTLAIGVGGALLGGLIASAVGIGSIGSFFSLATWLIALGGAFTLLVVFDTVTGRRSGRVDA